MAQTSITHGERAMEALLDVPLEVSVELGRVKMMVREVLELGTGYIVEVDKAAGEPVDVMVNGRLVAKGEVVVIEDNFGVRITEVLNPAERFRLEGAA
jgi:flagellar motor switch protein FliN/FliY